jgi:hypothetical protein
VIEAVVSALAKILSLQMRPYLFGRYFSMNFTGSTCSGCSMASPPYFERINSSKDPSGMFSYDCASTMR